MRQIGLQQQMQNAGEDRIPPIKVTDDSPAEDKIRSIDTDFKFTRVATNGSNTTVVFYDFNYAELKRPATPEMNANGELEVDAGNLRDYNYANKAEQEGVKAAFKEYQKAGNIKFLDLNSPDDLQRAKELGIEIPTVPDVVLRRAVDPTAGRGASAEFPDNDPNRIQYITIEGTRINEQENAKQGQIFLSTMLHEVGHLTGLEHNFDDGENGKNGFDDALGERKALYSHMSYSETDIAGFFFPETKLKETDYLATEAKYGPTLETEDTYKEYFAKKKVEEEQRKQEKEQQQRDYSDKYYQKAESEINFIRENLSQDNHAGKSEILKKYFELSGDADGLTPADIEIIRQMGKSLQDADVDINSERMYIMDEGKGTPDGQKIILTKKEFETLPSDKLDEYQVIKNIMARNSSGTLTPEDEKLLQNAINAAEGLDIKVTRESSGTIRSINVTYGEQKFKIERDPGI